MLDTTLSSSQSPRLIVLVGLPGSGKSTWARRLGAAVISSDDMRYLLADDANDQTIHDRVFPAVRYLLRHRLELRRPVSCIDATNLTRKERRSYLRLGEMYGCRVDAVFFDTPVSLCQARNRGRSRVVPDEVIEMLAGRLTVPTLSEGFGSVTIVSATAAAPPPIQSTGAAS